MQLIVLLTPILLDGVAQRRENAHDGRRREGTRELVQQLRQQWTHEHAHRSHHTRVELAHGLHHHRLGAVSASHLRGSERADVSTCMQGSWSGHAFQPAPEDPKRRSASRAIRRNQTQSDASRSKQAQAGAIRRKQTQSQSGAVNTCNRRSHTPLCITGSTGFTFAAAPGTSTL